MCPDFASRASSAVMMPGLVLDRYTLLSPLGRGNMGEVWRAQHSVTQAVCAIKVLHADLANHEKVAHLFVQEAQVGARLNRHPNIVHVFDAGIDAASGTTFLVMELLEGQTLDDMRVRHGPLPMALFRLLLDQFGSAVDAAHRANIVHRDLKPGNLFLTEDFQGQPLLKVLDFGIARILEESVARTATQAGTPAYAAPEQLGPMYRKLAEEKNIRISRDVSFATDVWALGLIAYDLLTGADAGEFWGVSTASELPLMVALEPAPVPSRRAGAKADKLPKGFDAWFAKCVQRDAQQRWPTFLAAAAELAHLIDQATRQAVETRMSVKTFAPDTGPTETIRQPASSASGPVEPETKSLTSDDSMKSSNGPLPPVEIIHKDVRGLRRFLKNKPIMIAIVAAIALSVWALVLTLMPGAGGLVVAVAGPGKKQVDTVQVFVDGRKQCDTSPCVVRDLSTGKAHIVKIKAPGYANPADQSVSIRSGEDVVVNVDLNPTSGGSGLKVTTEGSGQKLWVDGKEIGLLPQEIKDIAPGEHTIKVGGNDRYETYEDKVSVTSDDQKVVGPLKLKVLRGLAIIEPGANADGAKVILVSGSEKRALTRLPTRLDIVTDKEWKLVASKKGYTDYQAPLKFDGSTAERTFKIDLYKPGQSPTATTPSSATSPAAGQGTLNVNSIPVSNVIVDGRPMGSTPKMGLSVAAGTHRIVFVHPEHGRKVVTVTVAAGATQSAATRFP
jgi:serine/threonine protein kinase